MPYRLPSLPSIHLPQASIFKPSFPSTIVRSRFHPSTHLRQALPRDRKPEPPSNTLSEMHPTSYSRIPDELPYLYCTPHDEAGTVTPSTLSSSPESFARAAPNRTMEGRPAIRTYLATHVTTDVEDGAWGTGWDAVIRGCGRGSLGRVGDEVAVDMAGVSHSDQHAVRVLQGDTANKALEELPTWLLASRGVLGIGLGEVDKGGGWTERGLKLDGDDPTLADLGLAVRQIRFLVFVRLHRTTGKLGSPYLGETERQAYEAERGPWGSMIEGMDWVLDLGLDGVEWAMVGLRTDGGFHPPTAFPSRTPSPRAQNCERGPSVHYNRALGASGGRDETLGS
ncbi:hypothetical protein NMY22_g13505 [Coprinellus aureogranulatus]|nr:hypothetical protein NMY22_g13505 [Coprinellus aureogranulatus]